MYVSMGIYMCIEKKAHLSVYAYQASLSIYPMFVIFPRVKRDPKFGIHSL